MLSKIFKKENLMFLLLLLSLAINIWVMNGNRNLQKDMVRIELNNAALTSKMDTVVENGIKKYVRLTPSGNINDIINSEVFNSLSDDDKKFYLELKKVKGLLAASEADYRTQGEMLKQLLLHDSMATVTDSSIEFRRGIKLAFSDDTSKHMKYDATILMDNPMKFNLKYQYDAKISHTYEMQKDKSIMVKYTLEDKNASIQGMNSFIIPQQKPKTKVGRWIDAHKNAFIITAGVVTFGAGAYLGNQVK